MVFSNLITSTLPANGRYNIRNSRITGFTIHHQAGVNAQGESQNPRREVSANYWISNEGNIIGNIPEEYRAWTTGAAAYPAGANSDHRNITVEVSNSPAGVANGTWAISPAAKLSLEKLIGDVFKRYNLGKVSRGTNAGVAVHQDFVPTSCPGPYIMNNLNNIIANAESYRNGGNAPTPTPAPVGADIEQLAREVLAGKYGNGAQRQAALGANFSAVQARVNQILAGGNAGTPTPVGPNIEQLAREVLAGKYGNGAQRQAALGANFPAVQARVNQILAGGNAGTPTPVGPNIDQLAREVLAGKYGNGAQRQAALGANFPAVQARVNQILAGGNAPTPAGKTVNQLAREVIAGNWGNGAERQARLQAAGYNFQAIQAEVNRIL